MDEVKYYLNSKINKDDKIIVACSSGPDSMCLISLVMKITPNIICAHVNHNIRKQSKIEYEYLEDFCKQNNIIFEGISLEFNNSSNFESIARTKRYDFLNELYEKYNAKYILTAHHGDDLIETILMRITRGSKLSGYIGIKKENKRYLRPLLYVTKDDILKYLKENKIKYYEDYTNLEDEHTRNRYRKYIVPFLKKEDKNVHRKYLKFSEELEEYDDFVNNYIQSKSIINNNQVNLDVLTKESNFIKKKSIEYLIKNIQANDFLEVSDKITNDILQIINSSKSNIKINLNNDYIAQKKYNIFEIKKEIKNSDVFINFDNFFENDSYIIKKVSRNNSKSNYVLRLNSDDIKLPLIIRNRRDGDKMFVKNLGVKKLKDILINEKIDIDERKNIPLVCDSNDNILWIPGIKKSKFDKDKKEKYDIILLCERKEDIK